MSVDKKKKILIYFDYIYKKKLIFFISYFLLLLFFFFILGKINNKIQWQDEYEYIQRGLGISFIDFNLLKIAIFFTYYLLCSPKNLNLKDKLDSKQSKEIILIKRL